MCFSKVCCVLTVGRVFPVLCISFVLCLVYGVFFCSRVKGKEPLADSE